MFVALSVAYPLVVYWAMGRFEPRWLAVLLLALALLRALATRQAVWVPRVKPGAETSLMP